MQKKILSLCFIFTLILILSGCEKNTTSTLKSLEVPVTANLGSGLEPKFDSDILNYKLSVPNDITSIEVVPSALNKGAMIKINDVDVTAAKADDDTSRKGAATVKLAEGDNDVTILVQDKAADKSNEYHININREDYSSLRKKFLKLEYTNPKTHKVMPYRLYIPDDYNSSSNKTYPLVMFLHGGGERGDDNILQLTANLGATVWATDKVQKQQQMFVLAPQARDGGDDSGFGLTRVDGKINFKNVFTLSDDSKSAKNILDNVIEKYPIDTNRIYGTGVSQGGYGIWNLDLKYPDLFAAIVPISAGGDPNSPNLDKIVNQPIWTFQAKADPTVPIKYSDDIVNALKQKGSSIKYTAYSENQYFFPDAHFAWIPAYHDQDMIKWLLDQHK